MTEVLQHQEHVVMPHGVLGVPLHPLPPGQSPSNFHKTLPFALRTSSPSSTSSQGILDSWWAPCPSAPHHGPVVPGLDVKLGEDVLNAEGSVLCKFEGNWFVWKGVQKDMDPTMGPENMDLM